MTMKWHYNEVLPQIKNREAMQGEFFSSGSTIKGLIREAIQNSLDAKLPDEKKVHVSFTFGKHRPSDNKKYYDDSKHLEHKLL